MAYQIKHLKVPKVFDQAIQIIKDHFGLLIAIMMWLYVPVHILGGLAVVSMIPSVPPDADPREAMEPFIEFWFDYWPLAIVGWLFLILFVYPLTNAAIIQAVSRLYLGQTITSTEAYGHARKQIFPLIWANFLYYVVVYPGLMLCMVPGIIFAIWFCFVEQVVVIEGVRGASALTRSKQIVRNHFVAAFIVGLVSYFMTAGIGQLGQFIPQFHLQVIFGTIVQAAVKIFTASVLTVFYFSCRCANENFDLHYLAESLHVAEGEDDVVDLLPRTPN